MFFLIKNLKLEDAVLLWCPAEGDSSSSQNPIQIVNSFLIASEASSYHRIVLERCFLKPAAENLLVWPFLNEQTLQKEDNVSCLCIQKYRKSPNVYIAEIQFKVGENSNFNQGNLCSVGTTLCTFHSLCMVSEPVQGVCCEVLESPLWVPSVTLID